MSGTTQISSSKQVALRNVLVATDFSSASQLPLLYAEAVVRRYGAKLYLVHVVRPDPLRSSDHETKRSAVEQAWRDGQRLTTDLLISGELRGIKHELLVAEGDIWEGLSPLVEAHDINMIVTGTRGRTGLAKVLFGSVAERIFRRALCPVLTVGPNSSPPKGRDALESIMYATDFTPQSLYAAGYAVSLAQRYQAQLTMLHVLPPASTSAEERQQASDRLRSLLPADAVFQRSPEIAVTMGDAADQILDVAGSRAAGVIVLGVTQPGDTPFIGRRWSVASDVAGRAPCPVLTVRAPSQ